MVLITGTSRDDRLAPSTSNDTIEGGDGIDTLVLPGPISDYVLELTEDQEQFRIVGQSASYELLDIEFISFSDVTLELVPFDGEKAYFWYSGAQNIDLQFAGTVDTESEPFGIEVESYDLSYSVGMAAVTITGTLRAGDDAIRLHGGGSVHNSGTIEGTGLRSSDVNQGELWDFSDGISILGIDAPQDLAGQVVGSVTNTAEGVIVGYRGAVIIGGSGEINNAGMISGGDFGVWISAEDQIEGDQAARVDNSGSINQTGEGPTTGSYVEWDVDADRYGAVAFTSGLTSAVVDNSGTISGTEGAIYSAPQLTLVNSDEGVIQGGIETAQLEDFVVRAQFGIYYSDIETLIANGLLPPDFSFEGGSEVEVISVLADLGDGLYAQTPGTGTYVLLPEFRFNEETGNHYLFDTRFAVETVNGSFFRGAGNSVRNIGNEATGNLVAILPDEGAHQDQISNDGLIDGYVFLGVDNDTLANGGIIDGSVFLQEGDDHYSGAGTVTGYVDGGQGDDVLKSGAGDETLLGGAGSDYLVAGDGDDFILAGTDDDTMFAGANDSGDDIAAGGAGNDTLGAGAGDDLLVGDNFLSATAEELDSRRFIDFSTVQLVDVLGTEETLDANPEIDPAGEGADILFGGAGDDTLIGGSWNDDIGAEAYVYENGEAVTDGTQANAIWAGTGDDLIIGDGGNDQLGGGAGDDVIEGAAGDDAIFGGRSDLADTGVNDIVSGGAGNDTLFGAAGNDSLMGDAGDDLLFNGVGSDTVLGGTGNDILWGGGGNDVLTGGEGADTFRFAADNGDDVVTDFEINGDSLDLSQATAAITTVEALTAATTEHTAGDLSGVLIDTGGGTSVFLLSISVEDVSEISIASL